MSQFQDAIVRKAKTLKEQEFEDEALFYLIEIRRRR